MRRARLLAEPIALVFATRDPGEELRGLPELPVGGLRDGDARGLLSSVISGPLDERVRDRIVAETRGNPLALLELPQGVTPADLAGGFGLPGAPGLSGRIEDSFRRRLEVLPAATQRLMLVAAAEVTAQAKAGTLVWRAAERLGIGARALARRNGGRLRLLAIGGGVTFRHPPGAVGGVPGRVAAAEQRAAHQALADASGSAGRPPIAVPGIGRRRRRGLMRTRCVGAGALGEPGPGARRAGRGGRLPGALGHTDAGPGAPGRAGAGRGAGHVPVQARSMRLWACWPPRRLSRRISSGVPGRDLLRGQIAFASRRGSDAPRLLLKAATRQFEPLDPRLARETCHLDALAAAIFMLGRLALGGGVREVAEAARAAPCRHAPQGLPRPDPTCCWMAWRYWSRKATRRGRRCSAGR